MMQDLKILVVDADPKNLQILKESFEAAGFAIDTAIDGEKAWQILDSSLPDLILSEVNLPEHDGFQFLQKLKQNPATAQIPVVFLTNRRDLQDRVRSLRGGVKDYLIKPVHVKEVIARIRMILRRLERVKNEEQDAVNKVVGRLEESGVIELIENFGVERRSGILNIYNENNKNGEIHFRGGSIVYASLGMLKAEKAIYQMLPWKCGHYIITFKEVNTADSISVSNLGLLLQGFKRLEERERLIKQLPSLETTFVLSKPFQQIISRKELAGDVAKFLNLINGKRDIQQIIDESIYEDIKSLERLVKLSSQGFIIPGSGQEDETPQIKISGTGEPEPIKELPLPEHVTESLKNPEMKTEKAKSPENPHTVQPPTDDDRHLPDSVDQRPLAKPVLNEPDKYVEDDDFSAKIDDNAAAETREMRIPSKPPKNFPLLNGFDSDKEEEQTDDFPAASEEPGTDAPPMPMELKGFAPDTDIFEIIQELKKDRELSAATAKAAADEELHRIEPQVNGNGHAKEKPELPSPHPEPAKENLPGEPLPPDIAFSFPRRNYGFTFADEKDGDSGQILFDKDKSTPSAEDMPDGINADLNLLSNKSEIDELSFEPVEKQPAESGKDKTQSALSIFPNEETGPEINADDAKSLNQVFLEYLPFAENQPGTFVVIGATQKSADHLIRKMSKVTILPSGAENSLSVGTIALNSNRSFKLLAVSMEQQFTQILNGIHDNLTGFLLLFNANDKSRIEYLSYLYNSLNKKFKLPSGIAVIEESDSKSLAPSTVRDLINADESYFITTLNPAHLQNVTAFLTEMLQHYAAQKDREKHELE